jgi:hypothetical protein
MRPTLHAAAAHPAARATSSARGATPAHTVKSPEIAKRPTSRTTSPPAGSAGTDPATDPAAADPVDPLADFRALFKRVSTNTPAPAAPPPANPAPTAEGVFGPAPWLANPTGLAPDNSTYGYNPQYFATPETAAAVAALVGGKVVQTNVMTSAPGSPFQQQQPNQMVQLKNGALLNPGLVAGFYTHGYPQSMVDQMIANEIANLSS